MAWKLKSTTGEDGKVVKTVLWDTTDKPFKHECIKPKWKHLSTYAVGVLPKLNLWVGWKCQKCGLIDIQKQVRNELIDMSVIAKRI